MPIVVGVFFIGGTYLLVEALAVAALFASILVVAVAIGCAVLAAIMLFDIVASTWKNPVAPLIWLAYYVVAGALICLPSVILYFVWGEHTSMTTAQLSGAKQAIGFVLGVIWLALVVGAAVVYGFVREVAYEDGPSDTALGPVLSVIIGAGAIIGLVIGASSAISGLTHHSAPPPPNPAAVRHAATLDHRAASEVCAAIFTHRDFVRVFGYSTGDGSAGLQGRGQATCTYGFLHAPSIMGGTVDGGFTVTVTTGSAATSDWQYQQTFAGPLAHSAPQAIMLQTSSGGNDNWTAIGYVPSKQAEITVTVITGDVTQDYAASHLAPVIRMAYDNILHSDAANVVANG